MNFGSWWRCLGGLECCVSHGAFDGMNHVLGDSALSEEDCAAFSNGQIVEGVSSAALELTFWGGASIFFSLLSLICSSKTPWLSVSQELLRISHPPADHHRSK